MRGRAPSRSTQRARRRDGFEISSIALTTRGTVPRIDADEFVRHAEAAKKGCPVSKALAGVGEIELDARVEG